jgi:protein phosphatase/serine/threonine-protein phosphatase Stp1
MGQVRSWAETNVGAVRKHNEDNMLSRPDLGLWVVADGAGGHDSGEVASGMIVAELDRLPKHLSGAEVLAEVRLTLARVHAALREEAAARGGESMIASTFAGVFAAARSFVADQPRSFPGAGAGG